MGVCTSYNDARHALSVAGRYRYVLRLRGSRFVVHDRYSMARLEHGRSIGLRLSERTIDAVKALAKARETSYGSVLRQAIEEFMRRQALDVSLRPPEPVPLVPRPVPDGPSLPCPTCGATERGGHALACLGVRPKAPLNGDYIKCGLCAPAALPVLRAELAGHVAAHRAAFDQELAAATKR